MPYSTLVGKLKEPQAWLYAHFGGFDAYDFVLLRLPGCVTKASSSNQTNGERPRSSRIGQSGR